MENKVLTQEELQQLKSIQGKRFQLTEQFGILELKIQEYLLQKDYLKEELKKLHQEESKIGESLQVKYGNGTINLEKGEFVNS